MCKGVSTLDPVPAATLREPEVDLGRLPEALVQRLWQEQAFDRTDLRTTDGRPLAVVRPGRLNRDSGPDFSAAQIRLGDTLWAGDVEVHRTSGGWTDHRHDADPRYNGVVLHVVLQPDMWTGGLCRADGSPLPELVLYPRLQAPLRDLLYRYARQPAPTLFCAAGWTSVPAPVRTAWIERLADERLRSRSAIVAGERRRGRQAGDLLHERLFAGLGYAKNAEAMTLLARRLPRSLLSVLTDPLDVEALHLGTAGLLPGPAGLLGSDRRSADYVMDLRDRYERLRFRLDVPPMDRTVWHFFRLRPANFPPVRIAQGAAWLRPGGFLRSDPVEACAEALRSARPAAALRALLAAEPGPFWETHVRLDRPTSPRPAGVGRSRLDVLLVNAVAPVLHSHAGERGDRELRTRVVDLLRSLPAARDEVTRHVEALGSVPQSAFEAQGVHQLYRTRCLEARCLTCAIGRHLLGDDES